MISIKNILPYLTSVVIAGLTILWISLLFPQGGRFQYEFQQGFVWSYPDLFAPFDFPVNKSSEEIDLEKMELVQQQTPFYNLDKDIAELAKSNIDNKIRQWLNGPEIADSINLLELELIQAAGDFTLKIYQDPIGTLRSEDISKPAINLLIDGNFVKPVNVDQIISLSELKSQIENWKPIIPERYLMPLKRIIIDELRPNISFNEKATEQALSDQLAQVTDKKGLIRKGELIIPQGALVSEQHYQVLNSLKEQYAVLDLSQSSQWWIFAGFLLLTMLIIGVYALYLWNHHREILKQPRKLSFLFMWFFAFSYLVFAIENYTNLSSYLIPFCIVPIVVKNYFNERLAFFTHVVNILIASFLSNLGYEFTFLQILAGIVTVLTVKETREWAGFFKTILLIFTAYILGFAGLEWIKNGGTTNFNISVITWLSINAFLTLLAYPLIPMLERIFGFISSISLVELCDMNRPLLRELSIAAPGTFHHSLQVGNIAEDAANEIGANGLLVKTASLYHDIGKVKNPDYFIENQSGKNPHEESNPMESAKVIIRHVTEGAEMAKKAGLPKQIISFILTHHGTTRVEYFYRKYLEAHPTDDPEKLSSSFIYPGPKPKTKEECILMLADSIEAACKSLPDKNGEAIDKLVNEMVDFKIRLGQFTDADITFAELEKCKMSFKKSLKSIHHVRITYPDAPKAKQ